MGKTRIVGRENDPVGLVILGAWCGAAGSADKFLEDKLAHYKTFFDGLDGKLTINDEPIKLPPDVAFCALVQGGHSRWTYIARTHVPEPDVIQAHIRFDKMMLHTLRGIAGVSALPSHSNLIAMLPIRDGGLGLAPFEVIGPLAYQASVGAISATQQALTTLFYDNLLSKLDPAIAAHIKAWKHPCGSMWLRKLGALEDASCPVQYGFGGALRLRLGLHLKTDDTEGTPSIATTCPGCGTILPDMPAARDHAIKCASWSGGYGVTNRHHLLRDSLANVLRDTGATVSTEVQIADARMDIVVSSIEGRHYWFDVGVTSEAPNKMHDEKCRRYGALARKHDAEFHPLVFNTEARPHAACRKVLNALSCDFDVPLSRLLACAVAAIMSGNGLTVAKAETHVITCLARRGPPTQSAAPSRATTPTKTATKTTETKETVSAPTTAITTSAADDAEIAHALRVPTSSAATPDAESGAAPAMRHQMSSMSDATPVAFTTTVGQTSSQSTASHVDEANAGGDDGTSSLVVKSCPAASVPGVAL